MNLSEQQRRWLISLSVVLALGLANWQIIGYERILRNGDPVLLELAPRDPRSLLQGDYMTLRYALALSAEALVPKGQQRGHLIIATDADRIAHLVALDRGQALVDGQYRLAFRRGPDGLQIATDAWFFQEGQGPRLQSARYAELRLMPDGRSLVVDLLDHRLRSLSAVE